MWGGTGACFHGKNESQILIQLFSHFFGFAQRRGQQFFHTSPGVRIEAPRRFSHPVYFVRSLFFSARFPVCSGVVSQAKHPRFIFCLPSGDFISQKAFSSVRQADASDCLRRPLLFASRSPPFLFSFSSRAGRLTRAALPQSATLHDVYGALSSRPPVSPPTDASTYTYNM